MENKLQFKKGEILNLHIICNSRLRNIELNGKIYKVKLTSLAIKGKANNELINLFKNLGYKIKIVRGERSNNKLIKILEVK